MGSAAGSQGWIFRSAMDAVLKALHVAPAVPARVAVPSTKSTIKEIDNTVSTDTMAKSSPPVKPEAMVAADPKFSEKTLAKSASSSSVNNGMESPSTPSPAPSRAEICADIRKALIIGVPMW